MKKIFILLFLTLFLIGYTDNIVSNQSVGALNTSWTGFMLGTVYMGVVDNAPNTLIIQYCDQSKTMTFSITVPLSGILELYQNSVKGVNCIIENGNKICQVYKTITRIVYIDNQNRSTYDSIAFFEIINKDGKLALSIRTYWVDGVRVIGIVYLSVDIFLNQLTSVINKLDGRRIK